jgi:hypothetical protein
MLSQGQPFAGDFLIRGSSKAVDYQGSAIIVHIARRYSKVFLPSVRLAEHSITAVGLQLVEK